MSEPSAQQIFDSLTGIWAEITKLSTAMATRVGWVLNTALVTAGHAIKAGEDENATPYPLLFEADESSFTGSVSAATLYQSRLSCSILSANTTLNATVHSGQTIIVDVAAVELTPDTALPAPDSGKYWYCQIFNVSTGNVVVKRPTNQTLNNGEVDINIGAGKAALLIKTATSALRLIGGA